MDGRGCRNGGRVRIRRVWEKEGQAWRRRYWKEAKYRKKAEAMGFLGDADSKESACVQQTQVQSLGQENPLEKEMATYSSMLAWIFEVHTCAIAPASISQILQFISFIVFTSSSL